MASEAAKAVKHLLEFAGDDQQGLLEVIKDQPDGGSNDAILEGKTSKKSSNNTWSK